MADITMCNNGDCELKNGCFRFIVIPYKYPQPYLMSPKEDCEDKSHELFIDAND